jgi:hypothetical protein
MDPKTKWFARRVKPLRGCGKQSGRLGLSNIASGALDERHIDEKLFAEIGGRRETSDLGLIGQ